MEDIDIDFNELIDNYLVRESKPKSIGRYYPSEVGGCLRKTWFSYKIPKEITTKLVRIFEAGNLLHNFVTDVISSEKNKDVELIDSEIPIKIESEEKEFVVSGRIDNLVLLKINDEEVLVEVKSTKYLPEQVSEAHEMQLQLYMHATEVHKGIVLYIQKDNLQTVWFNIKYDKKKVDEIMKRFELLHECLMLEEMPPPEAKHNQDKIWMCDHCDWKDECDNNQA